VSFFYNEAKKQPRKPGAGRARLQDIPVTTLNQLGCQACPRNDDKELRSPKMKPDGPEEGLVYLLGSAPSQECDEDNRPFNDDAGRAILDAFGSSYVRREVRISNITQCAVTSETTQSQAQVSTAVECCRQRVIGDIERVKPKVVVGIGDEVLRWATTLGSALTFRGMRMAARFGSHVCWFVPIIYPNYAKRSKDSKKFKRTSEYELAVRHDAEMVKRLAEGEYGLCEHYDAPYDKGLELITGQDPGDMQRLEQALQELAKEPEVSIDIESADYKDRGALRPWNVRGPKIQCVTIGTFERQVCFAVDHPSGWGTEHQRAKVWLLLGIFLRYSGRKIAHNLALEMEWFAYFFGRELLRLTEWGDTMAQAHTFDERDGTKKLDYQTRIHFGFNLKAQSNVDPVNLTQYPIREGLRYCGLDGKWTFRLYQTYKRLLDAARPEDRWEYERKVRLAPTLILTEYKGLPVDLDYANDINDKLTIEIEDVERKLKQCDEVKEYERRFGRFEPSNPDQVFQLMHAVCKREEVFREDSKTQTIKETTDNEALSAIPKEAVPSASLILDHREASKIKGTYALPIINKSILCIDGRMRTKYLAMKAETSRLASQDPNLQNFPKRKRKEIRGAIYADSGFWIVPCDYGQIEFRVFGMATGDESLIRACWTKYDVHKHWAERAIANYPRIKDWIVNEFGVDWDEKGLKTLRQEMKNKWVFPMFFGSAARSCAASLHLPEEVASDLEAELWAEFPTVKKWQEKLLQKFEKNLYVEDLTGYRRRGALNKNQIINHPIQGTAAKIVLEGMCALSERAQLEDDWHLHPNINVHDDLTFWLPDEGMERRIAIIAEEMCRPRFDFINVPLIVEVSAGYRWHECEPVGEYSSEELFNLRNPYK
jgi:uracil-DNA glycosylase family 4